MTLSPRFANAGYSSVLAMQNMGYDLIFAVLALIGIVIIVLTFILRIRGVFNRLSNWILYGVVMDIVLAAFLPTMINLTIGYVGLDWASDRLTRSLLVNNLATIFLLLLHIILPIALIFFLYVNRDSIGR